MNQEEIIARLHRLEANEYAVCVVLAQVAAYLPAPDVLLSVLNEDAEVALLFSTLPEQFREQAMHKIRQIYELLIGMRRGIAEAELRRLPNPD